MKKFLKSKPFVFFDVDGVLRKGKTAIPGAKEAILKLKDKEIPIAIITNGGGEPEYRRAEAINDVLGLDNHKIFNGDNVFLCHSPMQNSLNKKLDGHVLITGTGDIKSVMHHYNFTNYITVEEYSQIFPNIFPKFFVDQDEHKSRKTRDEVENRLNKSMNDFLKIESVMMLTDVVRWELNIQLISDILISKNGIPGSIRSHNEKQYVEFHLASEDLLYKDSFNLPRIAAGSFFFSLSHLFNLKYKRNIEYILYGKPSKKIFEYAKDKMFDINKDIQATNIYMIGDNPPVDIKGANDSGLISILVRTGVFEGANNDNENPAKFIVNDVKEAAELILNHENI